MTEKCYFFAKKKANSNKIKGVLVLKGLFSETTYVCTKKPTQIRVQTGKLQIFGVLQTAFNFAYKEDKDFSTYSVCFIHSSKIDAKRLLLSASPNSKWSFKQFKTVDWIMLSLIMNINDHLWRTVSTSAHKVSKLLLALDDIVTLERKVIFYKLFVPCKSRFSILLFIQKEEKHLLLEKERKIIFVYC